MREHIKLYCRELSFQGPNGPWTPAVGTSPPPPQMKILDPPLVSCPTYKTLTKSSFHNNFATENPSNV